MTLGRVAISGAAAIFDVAALSLAGIRLRKAAGSRRNQAATASSVAIDRVIQSVRVVLG